MDSGIMNEELETDLFDRTKEYRVRFNAMVEDGIESLESDPAYLPIRFE